MNIRVLGSEVKDGDKKIGVINGKDILTYPDLKKVGKKWDDGDIFDASGNKVGRNDEGIVKLFLRLL
ncbi:hypothetical protein PilKf_00964 [Pillotina sp. SPG140]|jgi:hypothetical protein